MLICSLSSYLSMAIRFIFTPLMSVVSTENSKCAVQKVKYVCQHAFGSESKLDLPFVTYGSRFVGIYCSRIIAL